ncbi:MAG: hypothetical protein E7425_13050 [Ruminococcaceae bacterium]|nr:hypothetical protein [Oscillospiraceae bacterium]
MEDYMTTIVDGIMAQTQIAETPNGTLRKIVEFLASPKSVAAMIHMTELGQPALSGVVKELEEKFENSDFPLGNGAKNATNRRNIGWLVRYVMREYGYVPKEQGLIREGQNVYLPRIGKFSGSKHFTTAAVYIRSGAKPNFELIYDVRAVV